MDYETYYDLIEEAGIRPLCEQLYKKDKYAALRYFSIMEKIYCRSESKGEYLVEGEYNELAFSKDLNSDIFSSLQEKLKINPGNKEAFWDVAYKIFFQYIIFIKNTEHFNSDQKIELLAFHRKGIITRRLFDSFFAGKTDEITSYIESAILELKNSDKSTRKRNKNESKSFASFFFDIEIIPPLLEYLQNNNVIGSEGKWVGINNNLTDIMGFIDALKLESIIEYKYDTEAGRAFSKKFNVKISDRSLTKKTGVRIDSCDEYRDLIKDFKSLYPNFFASKS